MSLKVNLLPDQVLEGLQVVITNMQVRKVSAQYNNEADVKEYPNMLRATVIKDTNNVNEGQTLAIKLKNTGDYKVGQVVDFNKVQLKNGKASLWANQHGYVQVSLKGDSLDAR
ncbi:hypothetical protein F5ESL0236_00105 [Lactobacillus sp. ESL0236]|uniref:hypothetical protein n=1 Tax=unclassified Lactobacillus TaxID=2620435 RepID=UPI000EFB8917|nr:MULTISPECIES: hypothetical protein [unclassified Lactobacillus]RMC42349.1 hypothetical protein F5ESL0237_00105 [Lactobacillus sp. ESL0237]RMC45684.1 hypothetical protein F5ESL0234_00105 [Lactobacillus sp. ESL0234]RMC47145.1 hypothetical protein F5ESL0236_00105 [Lactobacillus sp. ESL0236]